MRALLTAAAFVAPTHRHAAWLAGQLYQFTEWAKFKNVRPWITHTKLAKLRGVQHRNTTREIFAWFVTAGIVTVNEDGRSSEQIAAGVAAGNDVAPGFRPELHVTPFSLNWGKVIELAKIAWKAEHKAADTADALGAWRRQVRAWREARAAARKAAHSFRGMAAGLVEAAKLKALQAAQEREDRFTELRRRLAGGGGPQTIGDILRG